MEFIEYAIESKGNFEISKIVFPLVIVLTQDGDLEQDSKVRKAGENAESKDKLLFSVSVAPLYNAEHVYLGQHLSELSMKMMEIKQEKITGRKPPKERDASISLPLVS